MQRRVEKTDGDGAALHCLVDCLEVALLHRLKLRQSLFALLGGLGDDHFAHRLDTVGFKEHMLGTAKTNALCAEGKCLRGIVRGIGVGTHIENAELVCPVHQAVKVAGNCGSSRLDLFTVDVAGGLHVFDQIHDALRSDLADHGFGAGFPDEQRRLIAGGAVIGAGVAQQALVHGLTHILVKLLCLLVDHAQQQALGAGGVQFLTGLVLDRAQMAAHPAEAALFRMMQGILTNHIVTSYPFLTDPACRGS